jgi:hypothetical protein
MVKAHVAFEDAQRLAALGSITPVIRPAQSRRIEIGSFAFGQVRRLDGLVERRADLLA